MTKHDRRTVLGMIASLFCRIPLPAFGASLDKRIFKGIYYWNKVIRADPYASQVNIGNVYLKEANWNEAYIEELRYFSEKAKYKDQVDASSGAFNVIARARKVGAF